MKSCRIFIEIILGENKNSFHLHSNGTIKEWYDVDDDNGWKVGKLAWELKWHSGGILWKALFYKCIPIYLL